MRLQEIIVNESTVAGGIATVATPLGGVQRRDNVGQGVYTTKGPYANSVGQPKKKSKKSLKESNEAMDHLIMSMAHELDDDFGQDPSTVAIIAQKLKLPKERIRAVLQNMDSESLHEGRMKEIDAAIRDGLTAGRPAQEIARELGIPLDWVTDYKFSDRDDVPANMFGTPVDRERHGMNEQGVSETTGVTDYAPKSQGGTRRELIAKYHKTKNPRDAEAARRAGATQKELQNMTEGNYHDSEFVDKTSRYERLRDLAKRQGNREKFDFYNAELEKLYGKKSPTHPGNTFKEQDVSEGFKYIGDRRRFFALRKKSIQELDAIINSPTISADNKELAKRVKAEKQKQGVAEGSKVKTAKGHGDVVQGANVKTLARADLDKNKLNLPKGYGDVVQPQKLKTVAKAKGVSEDQTRKAMQRTQKKDPDYCDACDRPNNRCVCESLVQEAQAVSATTVADAIFRAIKRDYADQGFTWSGDIYDFWEFLDEYEGSRFVDQYWALSQRDQRAVFAAVKQAIKQHFSSGDDVADARGRGLMTRMREQGVSEGLPAHVKKSDVPPAMRSKLTMKDVEAERPRGAYRYRVIPSAPGESPKDFLDQAAAQAFARQIGGRVQSLGEGRMKDIDIVRQDYERMSPLAFRNRYHMSKQQWYDKYKDLLKPEKQDKAHWDFGLALESAIRKQKNLKSGAK